MKNKKLTIVIIILMIATAVIGGVLGIVISNNINNSSKNKLDNQSTITSSPLSNLKANTQTTAPLSTPLITVTVNNDPYGDWNNYYSNYFDISFRYPKSMIVTERDCLSSNPASKTKELLIGDPSIKRIGTDRLSNEESIYLHYGNCISRGDPCGDSGQQITTKIYNQNIKGEECVSKNSQEKSILLINNVLSGSKAKYPNYDLEITSFKNDYYSKLKDILLTIQKGKI